MVDESVEHEDLFPPPARGVPIICALKLHDDGPIPLLYFGRETRSGDRDIPLSPEPIPTKSVNSNRPGSNNPLNSIIRKWEAKFARHGGFMESGDFVSSNGKNDGRYYEADEWLDDGDVDENGDDDEYYDVDLDLFCTIDSSKDLQTPENGDNQEDEGEEEEFETDEEGDGGDEMDATGGSWEVLIKRLESSKQPVVREVIQELEQVQAFPGHSKQKKQKSLRDTTAKLRRLLPKVNQIQSQWQAAVWDIVNAANNLVTMQSFIDLWNEVSATKQREEILKERSDLVQKSIEPVKELSTIWKNGESIVRSKHDSAFNLITKIWDLWNQEEECAGRVVGSGVVPGKPISRTEKRFAAHYCEILPPESADITSADVMANLLRIALFGSKQSAKKQQSADGEDNAGDGNDIHVVSLPATVHIYRKNELLKCKLIDVKSLNNQVVQVIDKDWESGARQPNPSADGAAEPATSSSIPEFQSFTDLFESYQQKYVRKLDRMHLPTEFDSWKYFAVKTSGGEYITLFDVAAKAAAAGHFPFTDKSGNPVFLPSITAARGAETEKRKKQQEAKEEKKRKREEAEAKQKLTEPPIGEIFVPFPEFSKDLFRVTAPVSDPPATGATSSNPAMVVD